MDIVLNKKHKLVSTAVLSVIQNKVNELVSGSSYQQLKPIEVVSKEVINGEWGNGVERKQRLAQAGYDYHKVQEKVNEMI